MSPLSKAAPPVTLRSFLSKLLFAHQYGYFLLSRRLSHMDMHPMRYGSQAQSLLSSPYTPSCRPSNTRPFQKRTFGACQRALTQVSGQSRVALVPSSFCRTVCFATPPYFERLPVPTVQLHLPYKEYYDRALPEAAC